MKMSDVKVGMRLKPTIGDMPEVTVVELTDLGFKYKYDEPLFLGLRIGVSHGGEHYGYLGDALYDEIKMA